MLKHQTPVASASERGFSLIELMIVVAIIGVLSSLAIPKFQRFSAKAKQAEAKTNLSALYTLQESYFGDNDAYYTTGDWGVDIPPLGFHVNGRSRYQYYTCGGCGDWTVLTVAVAVNDTVITNDCGGQDGWAYGHVPSNPNDDLVFWNGTGGWVDCSAQ